MVSKAHVTAAAARIAGKVRRTPVVEAVPGTWLKCEYMQHTGSFKPRGAFNRLLSLPDPAAGVVAASGGNAGLAVAYAAGQLGIPAEVWLPTTTPAVKVARLRALRATTVLHGNEYVEAHEGAVKRAAERGAAYCHAYDQPEMVAGAGTLGLELAEQIPSGIDTVLVSVGGGGLMAGVAVALAGRARVVAVEPDTITTLHSALAAGGPVEVAVGGIAIDSLGARRIGDIAYDVAVRCGVTSVLVGDDDLVAARRQLWQQWRIAVEYGAAAAYAALLTGVYRPAAGERVVVVLCGANTDPSDL